MDTNRLNHFKVLVEAGSVRKAAELLHISHAGLSKSVHQLEDELGVQLVTKDGRNIKITEAGRRVHAKIQAILESESDLRALARGEDLRKRATLRIGTFEVFSTYLAPMIVDVIGGDVDIEFIELIPGEIEQALRDGRIDVGITYIPIPAKDIDHLKVGAVEMAVYVAPSPRFQGQKVESFPFVVPSARVAGSPTRAQGLDGWPDDKVERSIKYRVSLMETAVNLVREGMAAAFLPAFVAKLHNQRAEASYRLMERRPPRGVDGTQPVYLVKRRDEDEGSAHKKIAKVLRTVLA